MGYDSFRCSSNSDQTSNKAVVWDGIICSRIDDGAAKHVEGVFFGVVSLQVPEGFGDVTPMSSWSVVALDFSMQSVITAIGFGSAIEFSLIGCWVI